jgi:uncharacterized membrane protein
VSLRKIVRTFMYKLKINIMKYIKSFAIFLIILLILRSIYNFVYKLCGKKHVLAIMLIILPFILIKPALNLCLTKAQKEHIKEHKDVEKVFTSPTITKEDPNNPWGKSSF